MAESNWILFDAGIFIGGLLQGDPRHVEARRLVEAARQGDLLVCTTVGILSEVYAALITAHRLTARRTHDARHAAMALIAGVTQVYTYDVADWRIFQTDGMRVVGPPSVLSQEKPLIDKHVP
jgi:predicted nucleic acid-binding protein